MYRPYVLVQVNLRSRTIKKHFSAPGRQNSRGALECACALHPFDPSAVTETDMHRRCYVAVEIPDGMVCIVSTYYHLLNAWRDATSGYPSKMHIDSTHSVIIGDYQVQQVLLARIHMRFASLPWQVCLLMTGDITHQGHLIALFFCPPTGLNAAALETILRQVKSMVEATVHAGLHCSATPAATPVRDLTVPESCAAAATTPPPRHLDTTPEGSVAAPAMTLPQPGTVVELPQPDVCTPPPSPASSVYGRTCIRCACPIEVSDAGLRACDQCFTKLTVPLPGRFPVCVGVEYCGTPAFNGWLDEQRARGRHADIDADTVEYLGVLAEQYKHFPPSAEQAPFLADLMSIVSLDRYWGEGQDCVFQFYAEWHRGAPGAPMPPITRSQTEKPAAVAVATEVQPWTWEPDFGIADAATEFANASRAIWPDINWRMCSRHMFKAVEKQLSKKIVVPGNLNGTEAARAQRHIQDQILEDVTIMIQCTLRSVKQVYLKLFQRKWADQTAFLQYWEEWWVRRIPGWSRADGCHGVADTNNLLEATNEALKAFLGKVARPFNVQLDRVGDW